MAEQSRTDVHWAGVFHTCYMLAKFGFTKIQTSENSPHITAMKDDKRYSFHVNANSKEDMAWGPSNMTFNFTHLVVLTHLSDVPNVYILKQEDLKGLIKTQAGRNWLDPVKYRLNGKYWDEI